MITNKLTGLGCTWAWKSSFLHWFYSDFLLLCSWSPPVPPLLKHPAPSLITVMLTSVLHCSTTTCTIWTTAQMFQKAKNMHPVFIFIFLSHTRVQSTVTYTWLVYSSRRSVVCWSSALGLCHWCYIETNFSHLSFFLIPFPFKDLI